MSQPWFYQWPIWADGLAILLILLVAVEAGYRLGISRYRKSEDAKRSVRGDVSLGSMLALLGLLLAFTYSFSLSRADMRKQAVINEANAIGTAFLRADLGAEPGRGELREGLLDYARTRIIREEIYGEEAQAFLQRSLEAQARLWPATKRALNGDTPGPIQASIVQAVNDVLDAHATRLAVVNDRIPTSVLALLLLVAGASLAVAAHNAGLNGTINRSRTIAFAFTLAALMVVIVDFDQGQRGMIRNSHQPLELVVQDLEAQLGR